MISNLAKYCHNAVTEVDFAFKFSVMTHLIFLRMIEYSVELIIDIDFLPPLAL